ncbi:MAG: ABC transporter ATP-binding protein [Ktedonobacteraceae bacterium]
MVNDDPPLLSVEGVTFGYERLPLMYNVSVQVRTGEMVGLLGPNGSGKTTLLRLVSGVLQPQQGNIYLQGRDLRQWGRRAVAQRVAVVPQTLHMPFAFTVEQMVSLGRTPFINFFGSFSKRDRGVVQDALQATDALAIAQHTFNNLSGGEQQRVLIALALAQEPTLLLLDEPTAHLDIKYQVEVLELAQRLNRERGVTVIAAMHDLNLAARYFPRLVLFQRGIVADAGPAEVLQPGLLSRVYGVKVQVGILRGSEYLSVLPPGNAIEIEDSTEPVRPRVHVMAGGGSGALLMRALADAHIPFAAGALNIGDSDHTLALRLASQVITEQPYAPISPSALEQVRASLSHVSQLIICPMPIGPGNVALLREALAAARRGLPVLLLSPYDASKFVDQAQTLASRDYIGGAGAKLLAELIEGGAVVMDSVGDVVEMVK